MGRHADGHVRRQREKFHTALTLDELKLFWEPRIRGAAALEMRINGEKLVDGGFDGRAKWGYKSDHDLEVKLTITESDEERFHTDMTLDGDADAGLSGASALVVRVAGENRRRRRGRGAIKWGGDSAHDFELSTTLTNDGAELFDTAFELDQHDSRSGQLVWTVKLDGGSASTRTSTARATSKAGSLRVVRRSPAPRRRGHLRRVPERSVEWDDCVG